EPLAQSMETKQPSPAIVDGTWAEAAKKGIVAGATAADVPPAPAPAKPLTIDALKGTAITVATSHHLEPNVRRAGSVVSFLVRGDTPKICTIDEKTARCAQLPEALATMQGLSFTGDIEEGADTLLAQEVIDVEKISQRVYRANGELVAEVHQIEGAVSRADGTVTMVATDSDGHTFVLTQRRGEKVSKT